MKILMAHILATDDHIRRFSLSGRHSGAYLSSMRRLQPPYTLQRYGHRMERRQICGETIEFDQYPHNSSEGCRLGSVLPGGGPCKSPSMQCPFQDILEPRSRK